jgi:hypothetical protein
MTAAVHSAVATPLAPAFYDGPVDVREEVQLSQRFFSYPGETGWVTGKTFNVVFTLEYPVARVWPYLKDFNLWQNDYGHFYSGIIGDMEGHDFTLTDTSSGETSQHAYRVVRVIPEHLIIVSQHPSEGAAVACVSPDHHVFMLSEYAGRTIVTGLMEHAALFNETVEEKALAPWRAVAPESQRKWRDVFIPTLRQRVAAAAV